MNTLQGDKVNRDSTRNIDMHGRRSINAGESQDSKDYVIQKELEDLNEAIQTSLGVLTGAIIKSRTYLSSLAPYTPYNQSGAYTGIDNTATGFVYATALDLNSLRQAYENLRLAFEDLRTQVLNSTKK